jgi:hypothetical protein
MNPGYARSLYGWYGAAWAAGPPTVDQYGVLTIESLLWDVRLQRAVWLGTSESTDPKDVSTLTPRAGRCAHREDEGGQDPVPNPQARESFRGRAQQGQQQLARGNVRGGAVGGFGQRSGSTPGQERGGQGAATLGQRAGQSAATPGERGGGQALGQARGGETAGAQDRGGGTGPGGQPGDGLSFGERRLGSLRRRRSGELGTRREQLRRREPPERPGGQQTFRRRRLPGTAMRR